MAKKKRRKIAQLPFRLNVLFFIVFILFSGLVLQLGFVQIINGKEQQEILEQTTDNVAKIPVPRGRMLDTNGNVLVDNEPVYSITYTPPKNGDNAKDKLELAQQLADIIEMNEEDLEDASERELKEYWYVLHEKEAKALLSEAETEELSTSEAYKVMLSRITEADYAQYEEDKQHLEVIAIKRELDSATELTPHIVKGENVTEEEYATIAENMHALSGIEVYNNWERRYPYEDTFKGFLGNIKTGIPEGEEDYFTTRGYQLNDRIGRSGLEQQYEDQLKGRKQKVQYITNSSNEVVSKETVSEGKRGNDLMLTIDIELQQELDKIVSEELRSAVNRYPSQNRYLDYAMAVMIDPNTGEIYAASAAHYDREDNEYQNGEVQTIFNANEAGSVVKGATLLAGYQEGLTTFNQVYVDQTIKIKGTPDKGSYSELGPVNDLQALQLSSNVYMFRMALKLAGEDNYQPGQPAEFSNPAAYQTLRNYYNQVGLGVETGIDMPSESVGYIGPYSENPGNIMDFSIGQYDTYTPMQLAQYVSTIANGGYRVRPHLVKEIHGPSAQADQLGPVVDSMDTEVLNRVTASDEQLERIQQGFRMVFQTDRGTAHRHMDGRGEKYNIYGKTGTAQREKLIDKENEIYFSMENWSLIGYTNADENEELPDMAFAIMVPNLGVISGGGTQYPITYNILNRALDYYYEADEEGEDA